MIVEMKDLIVEMKDLVVEMKDLVVGMKDLMVGYYANKRIEALVGLGFAYQQF